MPYHWEPTAAGGPVVGLFVEFRMGCVGQGLKSLNRARSPNAKSARAAKRPVILRTRAASNRLITVAT